jgi:hypothetical protein
MLVRRSAAVAVTVRSTAALVVLRRGEDRQGGDALQRRPQLAAALKGTPAAVLDRRRSRDVHFISGLVAHKGAFWSPVGPDVDPFMPVRRTGAEEACPHQQAHDRGAGSRQGKGHHTLGNPALARLARRR